MIIKLILICYHYKGILRESLIFEHNQIVKTGCI